MVINNSMIQTVNKIFWLLFVPLMIFTASCKQEDVKDENSNKPKTENVISTEDAEALLDKRIEENRHLQPERRKFMDDMLEAGLASRIENPTGQPYIYVTEPFYLLSRSEQASIMNAIWHYYITEDRSVDVLTIYDNNTGNEIGSFGRKGLLIAE